MQGGRLDTKHEAGPCWARMEAITYHIVLRGQQAGPFTQEQLREMISREEITLDQPGWRQGLSEWKPLRELLPPSPPPRVAAATPPPLPSRPAMVAAAPQPAPKPKSKVWLWVTLTVVLVAGGFATLVGFAFKEIWAEGTDEMAFRPLQDDRAGHQTKWKESSFEASGPADEPDGKAFQLIRYHSPAGELAAYLTPDPKDGKKHPAIVWAHGGFGGIGSYFWEPASKRNDQSARAFRENGIVMMCPSWRGENDNPGRFELFYGEVDDFLAAVEHVKKLPYVDPQRVYIGGHSTGGTMTLLAAACPAQFRAAFSFGGMMNGVATLEGEGYGNTPYDAKSTRDHQLRSPMRYAGYIRRPTFYFEGGEYYEDGAAALMQMRAAAHFHSFQLPGDHFDILHPITNLIAEKILADTGVQTNIHFTDAELTQAYHAAFAINLAVHLDRWHKKGGRLADVLEKADPDDAVPHTESDVAAVAQTVERITAKKEFKPEATADVAVLAELRDLIDDDDLLEAFDAQVPPSLIRWAQERLKQAGGFDEKEGSLFVTLLESLAKTHGQAAADLVVHAARQGIAPESHHWDGVFRAFDEDHPQTGRVWSAFAENPPQGYIGVLLLDAANQLFLDDWQGTHPFDSTQGVARLKSWLQSTKEDDHTYAHSAALGAAFVDTKQRGELIALALKHPDKSVRLEGAWSDVKSGGAQGLAFLKQACLEVHQSERAQDYLAELNHKDAIPKEALEPAFAAQAAMSRWLQHPNELGAEPLSIEVYHHKKLFWPPTNDQRDIWLIKFTHRSENDAAPETHYGCVGAMIWSSFEDHASPPKPEELYLHHCTLELERDGKRTEQAAKADDAKARALAALKKGNPGVFDALVLPSRP
jgi:hypothetical protein